MAFTLGPRRGVSVDIATALPAAGPPAAATRAVATAWAATRFLMSSAPRPHT